MGGAWMPKVTPFNPDYRIITAAHRIAQIVQPPIYMPLGCRAAFREPDGRLP